MKLDTTSPATGSAPARQPAASGRFLLRLDPGLHQLMRRCAAEAGLSLNDFCARKLAAPDALLDASGIPAEVVRRAAAQVGDALVGLVLYGSHARGTAAPASDVDLLLVVESGLPLTRELYRRWGEAGLAWQGHPVEVHFAHVPSRSAGFGGFWAEVALDGIVLFERGRELSRALIAVRHEILAGRIERRTAQGQPYWSQSGSQSGSQGGSQVGTQSTSQAGIEVG